MSKNADLARRALEVGASGSPSDTAIVELYENNAGHLFLHRDGDDFAYADVETLPPDSFQADAVALAWHADVSDWTLPTVPHIEVLVGETCLVAVFDADAGITYGEHLGYAACYYCGLPAPE